MSAVSIEDAVRGYVEGVHTKTAATGEQLTLLLLDIVVALRLTITEVIMVAAVGVGGVPARELILSMMERGALHVDGHSRVRLTAAGHRLRTELPRVMENQFRGIVCEEVDDARRAA